MAKTKQISPYYLFYIKGINEAKSNSQVELRLAVDHLKNALNFKETEEALHQLAICYAKLNDTTMYENTIVRGAELGFKLFYSSCGLFYANNRENANKDESLRWFNKGIEEKDPKSYADLAQLFMRGCFAFNPDFNQAELLLQKGFSLNNQKWNGYFAFQIANLCYEKKLYVIAARYYKKAIDYGYFLATNNLALMYRDGIGVRQDPEKYMELLMMHLNPNNAFEIAGIFLTNQFTPPDEDIAFKYFQYAASKGHPAASIMCAAFLIEKKSGDETLINRYLEIAFRNGINDENLKKHFDDIEIALGKDVSQKLNKLAEKYWNMRRSAA